MHPARSETRRAFAVACLLAAAVSAAHAQSGDPQRGRALYTSTNAAPLSCGQDGSCHGPDPAANQYRLLRGADDSALILRAIGSARTGMAFLQPHVDERDAIDLAAYLGEVARGRTVAGSGGTAGAAAGGSGSAPPGADGTTAAPAPDGAEEPSATSPFNAGYGGCAVGGDAPVDPVLPLLAFVAALAIGSRRRRASGTAAGSGRRAACAAMACVALAAVPAVVGATSAGEPAPDFALPGDDDATVGLGAGPGRVVWLDFWASWCAPCRQSLPWMARMQQRFGPRGLRVVTVALDADPESARRFARREAPGLTVGYDPSGAVARAYAIRAMPTSLLIGADGRVLAVHGGFRASEAAALERRIERALDALGDAPGTGPSR